MKLRSLVGHRADIVGPETPVVDVARIMLDRDVAAVAVVDRTGLVGICTERDLARSLAEGCDDDTVVDDVMTSSPDTVGPDVDIADAASWMLETGYRHLPVVEDGELLGIIDVRDVLWALIDTD
jgi:CBS domain-containing protein